MFGVFVGYEGQENLSGYNVTINQSEGIINLNNLAIDNASTVYVDYYYQTEIYYESEDTYSQAQFGVYERNIIDQTINNSEVAQSKADSILEEYAQPRETLSVTVLTDGFTPGEVVYCYIPELNILPNSAEDYLDQENDDLFLLENEDYFLLQNSSKRIVRQIQEVTIRYVAADNQLVSDLIIGKTSLDLIKTLGSLQAFSNPTPTKTLPARLSSFTPDLGVITAGLGLFTDGGTATFSWDNYSSHTGVIIGLQDTTDNQYGIVSVVDSGTEKVRLGRLNDLPMIGTVQPTGWGIYTQNGYFTGVVYGSELIGGTITGNSISGGTITGALVTAGTLTANKITSGTITGNLVAGGTLATGTATINSSNPGAYMDSSGLYGYGTAGLTFALYTNPALKPWFSSGTISNTVYEINTSAVLRTGTTNPRVQIDSSGIFAYDSGGVARFTVDTATGRLTASQGTFSGTVTASAISSGTITGALVSAGTVSGAIITGGTVTGNQITGGTITGQIISGGTVTGSLLSGGQITGGTITTGYISGSIDMSGAGFYWGGGEIANFGSNFVDFKNVGPLANNSYVLGYSNLGWNALYLSSPDNSVWKISVDNSGNLTASVP